MRKEEEVYGYAAIKNDYGKYFHTDTSNEVGIITSTQHDIVYERNDICAGCCSYCFESGLNGSASMLHTCWRRGFLVVGDVSDNI